MSNEIVKGFKATDKNMQCRGFQMLLHRTTQKTMVNMIGYVAKIDF